MNEGQTSLEAIRQVRQRYQDELMAKANVVGVGIGMRQQLGEQTGEPALVVMVSRKVPVSLLAPEDIIPASLDGIPVDVQEVGDLRAF
jgi:hypothetical protein